jgi:hypothetical protein
MHKFKEVILKFSLVGVILVLFTGLLTVYQADEMMKVNQEKTIEDISHRINRLEPLIPDNIKDTLAQETNIPSDVESVSHALEKGKTAIYRLIYRDLAWQREAYKAYWHSTQGDKWSYMPDRLTYGLHRIFTTYPTYNVYQDFIYELGIKEEAAQFNLLTSKQIKEMIIVVMKGRVKGIKVYNNQVLVICEPARIGLEVLSLPLKEFGNINQEEPIITQMVTPDGYEIDYSTLGYVNNNLEGLFYPPEE